MFDVEFQVWDIYTTYNMLLGQPWIHMAGAVAFALHQVVTFEWDYEKVVIMEIATILYTLIRLCRWLRLRES